MRLIVVISLFLLFYGCSNDLALDQEVTSSPYFPLEIGKYRDYQVQEIVFLDEGRRIDTSNLFLREEIVDTRLNAEDEMEYIIDISTRTSAEQSWNYQKSHRQFISENRAIRIEGNLPIIKLQFPISAQTTWDATGLFDNETDIIIGGQMIRYFQDWKPRYSSVSSTESTSTGTFENVTTVEVANSVNRLELRDVSEKYAPGIGLIHREIAILDTQCFDNCEAVAWVDKASKGHLLKQELIGYN